MKKLALVGMMAAVIATSAVAENIILSGDAGQTGSSASLVCTPVSDGVDLSYNPGVLVRTISEGTATGFTKQRGTGGKDVFVSASIPDGATLYLMGLASDWGSMSRNVDKVDVSKALAYGTFQGGTVSLHVRYQGRDGKAFNYAMLNAIAVLPKGTHAWAGVEGTTYSVSGPKGPFLLVAKTCEAPSDTAKQAAIALEGRK